MVAVNRKFSWQYGKAWLVGHCERLRGSNNIKKAYWGACQAKGRLPLFIAAAGHMRRGLHATRARMRSNILHAQESWISQQAAYTAVRVGLAWCKGKGGRSVQANYAMGTRDVQDVLCQSVWEEWEKDM